jgi:uncharacterized protein YacL
VSLSAAIRLAGLFVGLWLGILFLVFEQAHGNLTPPLQLLVPLGGAILGLLGAPYVTTVPYAKASHRIATTPVPDLLAGVVGLAVALAVTALAAVPLLALSWTPARIAILPMALVLGYMGWTTGVSRGHELLALLMGAFRPGDARHMAHRSDDPLLVDTSAIIDGRVADVVRSGFLATTLMVPRFVLLELQAIADSGDPVRRARGRRGLDVLDALRESQASVEVLDADFPEIAEVDTKLMLLARQIDARILTTDYNLAKVAEVDGLRVLNLNDLANALKPSVLPGEDLEVYVLKEGKEQGQGVGYLEDGTMVVVEGGGRLIGQSVPATVATVLQTAAGRLIFARPRPGPAGGQTRPDPTPQPAETSRRVAQV